MTQDYSKMGRSEDEEPVARQVALGLDWVWMEVLASYRLVLVVVALALTSGIVYALTGTKWYRAEVLLAPQKSDSSANILSQFSGLTSLAGIDLGSDEDVEPLAVLRSRSFARMFIEEHALITVLLEDKWDPEWETWHGPREKWPDERDAVEVFDEDIRHVVEDRRTGLVTVAVEWTDPVVAAAWASELVVRLNSVMRERAIQEAEHNVAYLRSQIESTDIVALHQSAASLLELELQKLMIARGRTQYVFRVVDEAQVPKKPVRPQLILVVVLAAVLGALGAVILIVGLRLLRFRG